MNKNLILEGNTIYELDPVCMRTKCGLHPTRQQGACAGGQAGKLCSVAVFIICADNPFFSVDRKPGHEKISLFLHF